MKALGIGINAYSNVLPVTYFFREQLFMEKALFIEAVPAELNRMLAQGTIDVGPVSAFAFAEGEGQYEALSELSVSSKGPVGSIFLFSKRPLSQLDGKWIALTNTSATSVNLLKIALNKFEAIRPKYRMMSPNLSLMLREADAALLIGDDAIRAKWNRSTNYIYDLGELWYKHTGMWMTFALWLARKSAIEHKSSMLKVAHEEFLRSKRRGIEQRDQIIDFVLRKLGGDEQFWRQYFSGLSHDFGPSQQKGLNYYFKCAAELGLIERPMTIKVWGEAPKANLT